ncbi:DUF342 domain-containing protein [Halanaerobaculum tunisiense]
MFTQQIELEAENREEALTKAYQQLQESTDLEFATDDISLELLTEEKKLWGLLGVIRVYQATIKLREASDVDGDFNLSFRPDGVYIKVFHPQGAGREVKLSEVEEVITAKEIVDVDYEKLTEALTSVDGEEVKIADRKPELDRDAEVNIEISDDQLQAYLDYIPPLGGKKYSVSEIIEQVKEAGVVYGLQEEKLQEEFVVDQELESFLIAQGEEPTSGEQGKIDLEFNTNRQDRKVNLKEDGTADFYNLNRIINVEFGDPLAEKIPPKEGTPGTAVTGEEIQPEPVEEAELPVGENVTVSQDGSLLRADMEGQVVYDKQTISVAKIHEINGNVDLSTGNIDFNGSVVVNGDIEDGMSVQAEGNVQVNGCVYNAQVEAGGQIIVKKGFIARNEGSLQATGDIKVKFVENGQVSTDSDLEVKEAIMHSKIDAGEKVIVETGKGLIVGGEVRAGIEISAKRIGSNLATPTEVAVGVTPRLRDEYNQLEEKFTAKQDKLDKVLKNISLLKKKKEKNDGLSDKKEQLLDQLIRQRFSLSQEIEDLKADKEQAATRLEKSDQARIKVQGTINPGVRITIGQVSHKLDQDNTHVQYYVEEEQIKSTSYS